MDFELDGGDEVDDDNDDDGDRDGGDDDNAHGDNNEDLLVFLVTVQSFFRWSN